MVTLALKSLSRGIGAKGCYRSRALPVVGHTGPRVQFRHLHAQWTYLLDHSWLIGFNASKNDTLTVGLAKNGILESYECSADPNVRTVMFLHDAYADKSLCEDLARSILDQYRITKSENASGEDTYPELQCLMVNTRGSGESCSDDFSNAHTVHNAAEDVLTLVQSVCAGSVRSPCLLVAYGVLGEALARTYLDLITKNGGSTASSHSEISGEGAVQPPTGVILLPGLSHLCSSGSMTEQAYTAELDVSAELLASAAEYMDALKRHVSQSQVVSTMSETSEENNTIVYYKDFDRTTVLLHLSRLIQ